MKIFLFPQITRFFSARFLNTVVMLALWFGLFGLISLNVRQFAGTPVNPAREILTHPLSPDPHITFAKLLWDNNLVEEAIGELLLSDSYPPDWSGTEKATGVLGDSVRSVDLVTIWKSGPEKITRHYEYWRQLSVNKPDYRDAHMIAGLLSYQLGNTEIAKAHLQKARALDPNYPPLRNLSF